MKGTQETQVKTKNNTKAILHCIAIILTVITMISLAIGLFAWSRYTATQSGNATASVAAWNFNLSLQSGSGSVSGGLQSLDLATTMYDHIAEGTIAPGTSGQFDIVIDTRGTEVSMYYDVNIAMTNCPRNITFSKKGPGESEFTVISAARTGNETERTRTVNFNKYLALSEIEDANENETTFVETIKWDWPYELTTGTNAEKEAYDDRDRADSGRTVTLNITATGAEVMNSPITETVVSYGEGKTVENGGKICLARTDEPIALSLASDIEEVTYSSSNSNVATVTHEGVVTPIDIGNSVITITGKETGKTIHINVIIATPVSEVTTSEYGRYVDIGTSILDKENIILSDQSHLDADWRVFGITDEGGVCLILADYMPNDAFDVTSVGLEKSTQSTSYSKYCICSNVNGETLVNGLTADWSELIDGSSVSGKTGVEVKGALNIEEFIEFWNKNPKNKNMKITSIKRGALPNKLSSDTYSKILYYPHMAESTINGAYCVGYTLASESSDNEVWRVYTSGDLYGYRYNYPGFGVRPVVYLPPNIKLNTLNTVWTIAE